MFSKRDTKKPSEMVAFHLCSLGSKIAKLSYFDHSSPKVLKREARKTQKGLHLCSLGSKSANLSYFDHSSPSYICVLQGQKLQNYHVLTTLPQCLRKGKQEKLRNGCTFVLQVLQHDTIMELNVLTSLTAPLHEASLQYINKEKLIYYKNMRV